MENTITLNSGQKIEVLLQDEVSLDIDCSLRYIKSGEREIDAYIKNKAAPQLDNVIVQAKADMNIQMSKGIEAAAQAAANSAAATISEAKNEIDDYTARHIKPELSGILETAEAAAASAVSGAQAAADCVETASDKVSEASIQANAASASADLAESWAARAIETVRNISSGWNLFDVKLSDHLLSDMSWLRADTFSWQSGEVYTAAYNELLAEYNNESSVEETEDNITFKRTPKGYKIAAAGQETAVLELFETTGVAWYYVLDTAGQRFKLPRTKYGFAGVRNNAGDYVPESLPNITGKLGATGNQMVIGWENNKDVGTSGVFSTRNRIVYGGFGNGNGYAHRCEIDFSAADCSSVYQDNAPVQERATEMYLYFYVGNYEQSAIEQTAGLNAELFNGKLDIGLENISSSGKKRVVRWGMPDYSAGIDVTSEFSAQTWWTATKSGWYVIAAGAESYFDIRANETETQRTIVAGAGPTPYILSSGVFVAEAGQRLYCHRKSGSYPVAMYYPFKGAN